MDTTVQLPTYSFAKSQGVIVGEITEEGALIYHLEAASLQALSEVKRMIKIPLILKPVDKTDFQKQLARVYEFKSSILDAAGDMEEEGDLHSCIAIGAGSPEGDSTLADFEGKSHG